LILLTSSALTAVPINDKSLQGAAAAEARLKLIKTAESYLGTPYRYAGVDKRGLDCSGLVYLSFREGLGYKTPRSADSIYAWTEKIDTAELQPGDLVFFVTYGTRISHVGIYTGEDRFIHSASEGPKTGVMYSYLGESYWKRTYKGAGRALPWDAETAQAIKSINL
jgi:probable lipoprotein NlpC